MVVLIVWVVVAVLAVVVLGVLGYGLVGALGRLTHEMRGLEAELTPVLADVQAALARAQQSRQPADGPLTSG